MVAVEHDALNVVDEELPRATEVVARVKLRSRTRAELPHAFPELSPPLRSCDLPFDGSFLLLRVRAHAGVQCSSVHMSPVLSTIKCRSPVPILARSGTGNPHARRLSVV